MMLVKLTFPGARYPGGNDEITREECASDVNEEVTLAVNPTPSEVVVVLLWTCSIRSFPFTRQAVNIKQQQRKVYASNQDETLTKTWENRNLFKNETFLPPDKISMFMKLPHSRQSKHRIGETNRSQRGNL